MKELNPHVYAATEICSSCGHPILYIKGMYHHLYKIDCKCMCDRNYLDKYKVK